MPHSAHGNHVVNDLEDDNRKEACFTWQSIRLSLSEIDLTFGRVSPPSYADFEKYYIAPLPDILKRLQIQPWEIEDEDGTKRIVSDVEMLYGDPFDPYFLDSDFWNRYEDSLALIDDQKVNLYFGKEKEDLKRIALLAENSRKILQEAFSDWIESKNIESKDSGLAFPKKCFVINFNYTNTVRKRFCVSEDLEYLQSCDDSEAVFLNMQYAIHHRECFGEEGYMLEMPNPDTINECIFGTSQDEFSHDQKKVLEKAAVRARFLLEQGARDAQYEFHFLDMFGEFMEDSHKISKKDRRKFEKQLEKAGWKDCQDIMVDVLNERKNKKTKKTKERYSKMAYLILF